MTRRYHDIMILLDGKNLAEKIKKELKAEYSNQSRAITLALVMVDDNKASEKFIEHKRAYGEELGVRTVIRRYADDISGTALRKRIAELVHDSAVNGIVVQLPLPPRIQTQDILNAVPPSKDVDVLSSRAVGDVATGKSRTMPPVVGAIDALFREYGIEYKRKKIAIIGAGRLVGKPVIDWFSREDAGFCVITDQTPDVSAITGSADIIISGVGKPNLIRGDMVKEGVIVIDAGTSESGGKLVGDVDFDSVAPKASYITPVPGGVGPLTVAMIFKNLLTLVKSL